MWENETGVDKSNSSLIKNRQIALVLTFWSLCDRIHANFFYWFLLKFVPCSLLFCLNQKKEKLKKNRPKI